MRVVVTGGCGFIGQHLVKRLKQLKHEVHIIDLNQPVDRLIEDPINLTRYVQVKQHFEELTDHQTKPIHAVFDLATMPLALSIEEPYKIAHQIWCMGTVLCELIREGYFKTLIHISSSEVYGTAKEIPMFENHPMMPQSPYGAAKAAQDMLMISYNRTYQSQICIVRPFNAFGEGQDLGAIIPTTIKRILKNQPPLIEGTGEQIRDFVYVSDIVRGIIEVWKQEEKCYGRIFHITGTQPISINKLVATIGDLMGYKGKICHLPKREGNVDMLCGSGMFAEFILGFKTRISLLKGLKRTIEWWKKQDFTL